MATPESLALFQQMLSPEPANREALVQALEMHEDPRVRLIAQYMNPSAPPAKINEDEIEEEQRSAIAEPAPDPARIEWARRARRKLRLLIDELELAQAVGDTLAAALGACYLCWGESDGCEECGGAGRPGWAAPDTELYEQFVVPAGRRLDREFGRARPANLPVQPCTSPGLDENGRTS